MPMPTLFEVGLSWRRKNHLHQLAEQLNMHAGTRLQEALIDLEFHMRDEGLWQQEPPSDWAFASELPFFHDRMSFPEWLQFVFIPNLQRLAVDQSPWPK